MILVLWVLLILEFWGLRKISFLDSCCLFQSFYLRTVFSLFLSIFIVVVFILFVEFGLELEMCFFLGAFRFMGFESLRWLRISIVISSLHLQAYCFHALLWILWSFSGFRLEAYSVNYLAIDLQFHWTINFS